MAIVWDQKVEVNWNSGNKKHLTNNGYIFTELGDAITIEIKHLGRGSKYEVRYICDWCGTEGKRRMQLLNKSSIKNNFCSQDCSTKHRSFLSKVTKPKSTCEQCGCTYKVNSYRKNISRFCSAECRDEWTSVHFKGKGSPVYVKRNVVQCDWCDENLERTDYELSNRTYNFCDRICQRAWHKNVFVKTDKFIENARQVMIDNIQNQNIKGTLTLPHVVVNEILEANDVKYTNEYKDKLFLYDIHLTEYDLYIEVMGGFWHADHRDYDTIPYDYQLNRIIGDKRKKTHLLNSKGLHVLYLWEKDILNNPECVSKLIDLFIDNKGRLTDYHSFNYFSHNDTIYINDILEVPHMNKDYSEIIPLLKPGSRERVTTYRKDNYITFNCEYCGEEKEQLKVLYNRNKSHFCSVECRNSIGQVDYNCDYCDSYMKVPKHRFLMLKNGKQKTLCCSKSCYFKYKSTYLSGENDPQYSQVKKICNYCNNEYSVPKGRNNKTKYCSHECRQKGSRKRVELPCDYCGTTITKTPSQLKKTKNYFCSHKCADTFRTESLNEIRHCEVCNGEFTTGKKNKKRFCSIKCQGVWQSIERIGENSSNYKNGMYIQK